MTKTVRLVDIDGEQLGVVQTTEALRIAREKGLDLVLVAPSANPPVARILFYVVLIFGYFHDTTGTIYRTEVMILVAAQGVSGFYGLLHQKRWLAVVFSLGYWILVGVAMGRIAYFRLGNSGIVLTVVLMLLVAAQDVRRIFKPLAKNPFMQGGEDSNE